MDWSLDCKSGRTQGDSHRKWVAQMAYFLITGKPKEPDHSFHRRWCFEGTEATSERASVRAHSFFLADLGGWTFAGSLEGFGLDNWTFWDLNFSGWIHRSFQSCRRINVLHLLDLALWFLHFKFEFFWMLTYWFEINYLWLRVPQKNFKTF